MEYRQWLESATARLIHSDSPKRDAEILLGFITKKTRTFLLAFHETHLTDTQQQQLEMLLLRREKGEPIAYIVGEREFWSLPISVSPATLIPRSDSEYLVELALEHLPISPCQVLDLGTGTGAIALALATERPDCMITGVDIHPAALALALHNAQKLKIRNVRFLKSDWFGVLTSQTFSLIASNPPYIEAGDIHLTKGDLRFEPTSALVAEACGLSDLDSILRQAPRYLKPRGWLLLEHGWKQGSRVRELFLASGFVSVSTYQDYGKNDRVTLGCWSIREINN